VGSDLSFVTQKHQASLSLLPFFLGFVEALFDLARFGGAFLAEGQKVFRPFFRSF
jgi:hypothetical protein